MKTLHPGCAYTYDEEKALFKPMGVGNIRDVGEDRTKRGIPKVAATGRNSNKNCNIVQ